MSEPNFDGIPICGVVVSKVDPLAKWPGANPSLPWNLDVTGYNGGLSDDALREAFAMAWGYWADVVEIDPRMVQTATEALIRSHFARIDGPSNVLAWSYLADNTNNPKIQRFDAGDTWVSINPGTPSGGIDLVRVACHEIGHVLGLEHDSASAAALMRPSYSTSIPKPTERDVSRLVGLGYKRRTTPVPPPPSPIPDPPPPFPQPPAAESITIDLARRVVTLPMGWQARNQ